MRGVVCLCELAAVGDHARGARLTRLRPGTFDRLDDILARLDLTEDDVLTVEPRRDDLSGGAWERSAGR